MKTPSPKIFGIGFHKTGTSSLADALRLLGYTVTGPNGNRDRDIARKVLDIVPGLVERYDAFQDNPWPVLFEYLDRRYPGSKFILTVRPTDKWISSVVRHFGAASSPMRTWIYGVGFPLGNEAIYVDRYNGHNEAVRRHFRGRSEDLLELDLAAGDGWEKLSPFLGQTIPQVPFPHANAADERERRSLDARPSPGARARQIFRRLFAGGAG